MKATEFISHDEIMETLDYAEKNKENIELIDSDLLETSALAMEKIWDEAEYLPDIVSRVPDKDLFAAAFKSESLPYVVWKESFNLEDALKELEERYIERLAADNGHI